MEPARDYLLALETLRKSKNILMLVAILAPTLHLAAWIAVQFWGVLDVRAGRMPAASAQAHAGVTEATVPSGSGTQTPSDAAARVDRWDAALRGGLPLAEFIGRSAMVLLIATLTLAVLVCLVGRLSGVSDLISALYVAIFVGVLFIPWERIAPSETNAFCVFTTVEKLKQRYDAHASTASGTPGPFASRIGLSSSDGGVALDGLRFGAFPLLSMLLLGVSGSRFGRAVRSARQSATAGGGAIKIV